METHYLKDISRCNLCFRFIRLYYDGFFKHTESDERTSNQLGCLRTVLNQQPITNKIPEKAFKN